MALYNKRVVTPQEAVSEWGEGTIIVCEKQEGPKTRIAFLYTSGSTGEPVGSVLRCYHDQTGASKGDYRVVNNITFEDNQIVKKDNEVGLNRKASLAVFK